MKHHLLLSFLVLHSLVLTTFAEKPNIVLILADDMGYADIGAHGCKDIPTPNIDLIGTSGVRFTAAYANGSFCTPTRAALMSCRYQQRSGNDDLDGVTGPLPLGITALPDRLRAAGYTTGMVGKWHLGGGKGYTPLERGFDEFFGFLGGGHFYLPNPKGRGGYYAPIYNNREPVDEQRYLTDAFGEEAAAFVERQRNATKPFFLYLAFNAVHTPLQATEKYLQRFEQIKDKRRRVYAAMLSAMDDAIGRVMNKLKETGKLKGTLVIFHNDNGGPTTRNAVNGSRNTPLRGSKCETFEGGIRVPQLFQWPGVIEAGSVYHEPVMTFDLSATALSLAGADMSDIDGVDLIPFLSGKRKDSPHEALFWRSRTRNNNYGMRLGDWKFVHSTEGTERPGPKHIPARDMLFNLADDLSEQNDLAADKPDKLAELKHRYDAWSAEVDADCRKLGIEPPMPGKTRRAAKTKSPVGEFKPTKSFPGFDELIHAEIKKSKLGFEVASPGNGLALQKLDEPVTGQATFRARIQPPAAFPSNGFLAFGSEPTDAATVKCGMLVGGNKFCAFNGAYPPKGYSQSGGRIEGGKIYEVEVQIDLPAGKATIKIGKIKIEHRLPPSLKKIQHIGYAAIRTRANFSKIEQK
ncbi:MAG: sulfatase-like hydrolase/transferase [Planctomycetota bacterium]|jgi:arylsulfatase A-like enzyme|nr:sulfatase-like hydrolase/transferase [Planctomycetota bacterium]MDP7129192.1 sulfatase-like hydrolase/transferase [Planctomycetota bacterium]